VRLTYVSRFAVKFIEVAGAGLASALCAYFLGQIERSPAPAPATAVVQISPATIENAAREAGVAVAAQNAGHAARACEHRARHALGAETREVFIYRTGTPQGEVRTGGRERGAEGARRRATRNRRSRHFLHLRAKDDGAKYPDYSGPR